MTASQNPIRLPDHNPPPAEASRRLIVWSVEDYLRLIETGALTEHDKTELIDGHILYKMPSNKPHDTAISFLQDFFIERYFKKYTLRSERAIKLSDNSMPEPDYVVALYREDNYRTDWPAAPDVLLLVEVSDSTLAYDRTDKMKRYAAAGIPEYWIINIPDHQVELHLTPDAETVAYADISAHSTGETFTSLFAGEVAVDDVLPPQE